MNYEKISFVSLLLGFTVRKKFATFLKILSQLRSLKYENEMFATKKN
jgi:hypothetical protein